MCKAETTQTSHLINFIALSRSSTDAHGSALYLRSSKCPRPLTSWGCAKFMVPGVVWDKNYGRRGIRGRKRRKRGIVTWDSFLEGCYICSTRHS